MRRIVLLAAILIGFSASAQNLSLSDSTGNLSAGDTVTVNCMLSGVNPVHVFVHNNGADISAKCKKTEISIVGGSENYFCWGLCFLPTVFVSPFSILIETDSTSADFIGDYEANGFPGTSIIMYTFFDEVNSSDSVHFFAKFVAQTNNIGEVSQEKIEFSNAFPNPADAYSLVTYRLPLKSSGNKFVVRDMLGNNVMDVDLFDKSGTIRIDTDRLGNGVYFYTMFVDNKPFATRKLIVKH